MYKSNAIFCKLGTQELLMMGGRGGHSDEKTMYKISQAYLQGCASAGLAGFIPAGQEALTVRG